MQREILWALANTGECSLPDLLSGLALKFPDLSFAALQDEVKRSLGILGRAGCLYVTRSVGGERKNLTEPQLKALDLGQVMSWDDASGSWQVGEDGVAEVVVQLTNGGVQWLDMIAAQSSEPVPVWRPRQ